MDAVIMFHFIHHKSTFQRSETVDCPQNVQDKLLIVFHIGSMYL